MDSGSTAQQPATAAAAKVAAASKASAAASSYSVGAGGSSGSRGYMGRCRSVDAFEKLNRLGEGTYGTVYRARDTESSEIVALKKVRIHEQKDGFPRSSLREVRLLRRLRHPNIVELRDVVCGSQANKVFLVFEYCEHDIGALLDLMERPFGQAEVKCLVLQLLKAVEFLHSSFVIHRDIKLSNLLLNNKGVLKLADFGLAREFTQPPEPYTTNVVTLWYRCPELLFGAKSYTTAVDIWSIGCNFGELLKKRPLLPGKNEEQQVILICELLGTPGRKIWPALEELPFFKRYAPLPTSCVYNTLAERLPAEVSDDCLELLNRMLTFDPQRRPTAAACLQHRYFVTMPAPQEPQWMPTFKEHRNETANPRALGMAPHRAAAADDRKGPAVCAKLASAKASRGSMGAGAQLSGSKRFAPLAPRSALFAAAKKMKSSIF